MPSLSDAINDLVAQRLRRALETGETIHVPDLVSEITEGLADLIVSSAPPNEQPRLIDHAVFELDRFVTEKRRAGVGRGSKRCLAHHWLVSVIGKILELSFGPAVTEG
jgi:hypothetical protein